jgi:hypothetical protein
MSWVNEVNSVEIDKDIHIMLTCSDLFETCVLA